MKRVFLFVIFYMLLGTAAFAQGGPSCLQTPSPPTSNTQCANTAFVHGVAATVTPSAGSGITVTGSPPTIGLDRAWPLYTDIRQWGATPPVCNPSSPTSTNVAAAVIAAYNAGYIAFSVPSGCFVYTGDSAWASAFGSNNIPTGTFWQGGNWQTSGFSVCSTFSGCAPGAGNDITVGSQVVIQNMFYQANGCYNVDGGRYGNPSYCPLGLLNTGTLNGGFVTGYPFQQINLYMAAQSLGTWNGTDSPQIGLTNESQGDSIFIANYSGVAASHLFNLYNSSGNVGTWNTDGKATFGDSSTSHSGNGMITITDATGTCGMFTNSTGSPGFACSSDRRLKRAITDDGDELKWLDGFRVRDYVWRKSGDHAVSPVAQELKRTHPEMVRKGSDGYLQIFDPNPWKMIKAMQQMQAEIDQLKRELRHD